MAGIDSHAFGATTEERSLSLVYEETETVMMEVRVTYAHPDELMPSVLRTLSSELRDLADHFEVLAKGEA